jgi:ribonuclease HII
LLRFDECFRTKRKKFICGVDEAGRGPLAGPVVAAAVIFERDVYIKGVYDSKQVLPPVREELYQKIMESALAVGIGICDNNKVDEINILNATTLAMDIAISELKMNPHFIIVDGNHFTKAETGHKLKAMDVIGGDEKSFSIAAASIIAKVTRDRIMAEFENTYPQFRFSKHKGYSTPEHVEEIGMHGLTEIHRKSFRIKALEQQELFEI